MTYRSIRLSWNSYLYLQKLCRAQRCPNRPEHSEAFIQRMRNNFKSFCPNGLRDLTDGDLGGAEGERWTSWTVEQMAAILDEAKLPYIWGQVEMIRL